MLSTGEPILFDEASTSPSTQILRRILHAHVVLRQLALRRHNLDRAGMGELVQLSIRPRNLRVPKSHRLGQRVDLRLLAGQEMPSIRRLRLAIALHVAWPSWPPPDAGPSVGSMLTTITSKSLPGVRSTIRSAEVSPFNSSEHSIGHW